MYYRPPFLKKGDKIYFIQGDERIPALYIKKLKPSEGENQIEIRKNMVKGRFRDQETWLYSLDET